MFFFFKLLLRNFDVVRQLRPCNTRHQDSVDSCKWKDSGICRLKYINHKGAKMINRWNVNKITAPRTKMEVGKIRTRAGQ